MKSNAHYYVTSALRWAADVDMDKAIEKLKKRDKDYFKNEAYVMDVWKVPLPIESEYKIEWYKPVVEGVEFIKSIKYGEN